MLYNLKRCSFIIMLILLFINLSCKNNFEEKKVVEKTKNTLNYWRGKKISMPNDTLLKNQSLVFSNPKDKKLKIITLINGDCDKCVYELKEWEKFRKKIKTNQLGIVYLVYSYDNLSFFNNLLISSNINFSYPYFEDVDKKVTRVNNFPKYDTNFQTFLVDKSNKIILAGNPISNKKVEELYLKEIIGRLNDQ
jgi:hypothetical protein